MGGMGGMGGGGSGSSGGQGADAAEVLHLANLFFPQDVMDITRTVVECAHRPLISAYSETNLIEGTPGVGMSVGMGVGMGVGEGEGGSSVKQGLRSTSLSLSLRSRGTTPRPMKGTQAHSNLMHSLAAPDTHSTFTPATPASASASMSALRPTPGKPAQSAGALVAYTGGYGVHGVHGVRGSDIGIGMGMGMGGEAEDALRVESLRWLYFDPTHRVEAVRQTNRFIVTFLSHRGGMKVSQVRLCSVLCALFSVSCALCLAL
jgi:hypothetical protein